MPIRTCVACRRRAEKAELLRWTEGPGGEPVPDPPARAPGRGGYVCRSERCLEAWKKRRRRSEFPAEVWEAFRLAIQGTLPQNVAGETHEN